MSIDSFTAGVMRHSPTSGAGAADGTTLSVFRRSKGAVMNGVPAVVVRVPERERPGLPA